MNKKKKHTQRKKDDRTLNILAILAAIFAGILWMFGFGEDQ
tara:strand:- start:647 stop:769 length:123 start_codon:yes stop_codon:yes gene_type:complete